MTITVNGAPIEVPNLDISLQIPTKQDPRCLVTLQAPVMGQLALVGIAREESDVVLFYSDGTQVCTGKGLARTHTLRTVGGRDTETLIIELSDVQGL